MDRRLFDREYLPAEYKPGCRIRTIEKKEHPDPNLYKFGFSPYKIQPKLFKILKKRSVLNRFWTLKPHIHLYEVEISYLYAVDLKPYQLRIRFPFSPELFNFAFRCMVEAKI